MFLVKQEKFFASLHTQMDLLTEASRLLLEGGRQGGSGSEIAETIDRLRGQAADFDHSDRSGGHPSAVVLDETARGDSGPGGIAAAVLSV